MTGPLSPEQIEELMAGYVLGDLSPEETEQLRQLTAKNPQLAAEINGLQETLELLPYALPEVEPPTHLRSAILEAASVKIKPNPLKKLSRLPWTGIVASVAALLALALGLDNYRLRQALLNTNPQTSSGDTLTYFLKGTKSDNKASASVMVNPNNLEARLTVQNLSPLPPGKIYALWTVLKPDAPFTTDSKGAILTEVFDVDAQGRVSQTITLPKAFRSRDLISKFAVTVEDAASPQTHKGSPILIANL